MDTKILEVSELNKRFGGVIAVDNVDFDVIEGELHALIGPNGAGKTTLISQISGILESDSGEIRFSNENITNLTAPKRSHLGLARSFQITSIFKDFTCLENVCLAILGHSGHNFQFWHPVTADFELKDKSIEVLRSVGLEERSDVYAGQLAHGEQRRLDIAMALAMKPKLMVLDEPLAGMSRTDSTEMINFLNSLKSKLSILLVEHDMDAVFALADRISVMVYGRIIADGTPDAISNDTFVREAYLGEDA